ncbi:MAG TPA: DUF116 domain-containing protein [Nitrospirae bacterium]|nr:hypothetical protein BMS3Abin10_00587 [bacterium BMS3Abin10]GBE39765.1 hypothetical protein BMS3Bbin08_02396 [bacterium BMS3Bbin08]HDH50491.1 DUF116 domain-containing protein [Nitrospirota bacterium]HDK17158.1 DUF116 domain-containing protein [Nitrospirota bacterium]HDK82512.1 DUF116 domain-containing protein [Nitrospirota bacterium]
MVRGLFFKLGYPLLLIFGWVFRIRKDKVQRFLIDVNNRLVRRSKRSPAKRLLLLLPHCLQRSECNIKITFNIFNCEGCGKCEIKDFVEIAKAHGLDLFIATGGTIARRIVVDTKPEAIVAVACERDLSSGVIDTYPLPLLGIINERPHGPCFNTRVDIEKVRDALAFFASNAK